MEDLAVPQPSLGDAMMKKDLVPILGRTVLYCPAWVTIASCFFLSPLQLKLKPLEGKGCVLGAPQPLQVGRFTRRAHKMQQQVLLQAKVSYYRGYRERRQEKYTHHSGTGFHILPDPGPHGSTWQQITGTPVTCLCPGKSTQVSGSEAFAK